MKVLNQLIQQINHLEDFEDYAILTGDFNSFGINGEKEYMTFRDFAAPDDIFYSDKFTVNDQGLIMSSFSDHNLLYAELILEN